MKSFVKKNSDVFCVLCVVVFALMIVLMPLSNLFGAAFGAPFFMCDILLLLASFSGAFVFADMY